MKQAPSTLDTIPAAAAHTLPGLFLERCRRTPDAEAYREFDASAGRWKAYRWCDMRALAGRWQAALRREHLQRGERVAILLPNGVAWVACDIAAQAAGLVVVPLYLTDHPDNLAHVLGNAGVSLLVTDTHARWRSVAQHRLRFPALRRVVHLDATGDPQADPDPVPVSLGGWLAQENAELANDAADPHGLATLVYTSGTTGRPKGVMLSHHNLLSNADAVLQVVSGYREDVFLSFLPLSHTFERTVGYYVPMMAGSTVAYARSLQELASDLATIEPTVLVSVPRVYEQAYARIDRMLERKGRVARALFDRTAAVGWRRFEAAQGRAPAPGLVARLAWPLLQALVARKVTQRFGRRLRLAVSGGAPLAGRISHALLGLGVPLVQGYGLTETSPIVCANLLHDNVPESVGRPLPGVEVRLGERDELLVRGPGVMLGYWENPEATRCAIDPQGWFHTGDQARIENGRVSIVGRIKEVLVLSTGEKVSPADVELAIQQDPAFAQVMLVGEARPYLAALVVLDREAWQGIARDASVDPDDPRSLESRGVRRRLVKRIEPRLAGFPGHVRVRAVWPTLVPWTIEEGLITPTLKLRRTEIGRRFALDIESLYPLR